MGAGKYDAIITIEYQTGHTVDDYGEATPTWAKLRDAWANVVTSSQAEYFAQGQETAIDRKIFIIRYVPGITAGMRVLYDDKVYDLTAPPREIGRRHELELRGEWTDAV